MGTAIPHPLQLSPRKAYTGNTQKDLVQNALPRQTLLWDKPRDCWKALCSPLPTSGWRGQQGWPLGNRR